jgi:NADPH:quinone reductase-like Zn-dependent oxidoreductase
MIPSGTSLTAFHSQNLAGNSAVLQRIVREVEAGIYHPNIHRVFPLEEVVAAHHYMEANHSTGKLVLLP